MDRIIPDAKEGTKLLSLPSCSSWCIRNGGHALVILQALSLWPIWRWYLARLSDGSDEPWGIMALLTVAAFVAVEGKEMRTPAGQAYNACALLQLLYVISLFCAPPLIRAILGLVSLATLISAVYFGRRTHLGVSALCVLSLPIIASLQFYGGYPLRILTAECAAAILKIVGFAVTAQGTGLQYLGEMVAVDAPCSGIKMLWSGLYIHFTLACFSRMSPLATWLSYLATTVLIFTANLSRATILFFGEANIVHYEPWIHQGVGLALFAGLTLAIAKTQKQVRSMVNAR